MSVPPQYYLYSEAYQKYLNNGLRPTELLKSITEGPVDLAPGELFCRWHDAKNGSMCDQGRKLVSVEYLRRHYTNVHKCEVVAPPRGGRITPELNAQAQAANKKPSWPMNTGTGTDTDTTPTETQATSTSDVATSEVETQATPVSDVITPEVETQTSPMPDVITSEVEIRAAPVPDVITSEAETQAAPIPDVITPEVETQATPASYVTMSEVETQAAPVSDVMTFEAELLQGFEWDELDMTGDEDIWREAWAAFDETAL